MPVTVKNYAGNICKDNPRLFNILQVSFLKEKADFLKKNNNINALYEKIPAHDLGINKHKNAITKKK